MPNSQDMLCAKCTKHGSIAICFGCQRSFCSQHFIAHRLHLAQKMDELHAKCMTLEDNLRKSQFGESLLLTIDTWEEESIKKIHEIAEAARNDLRQSIEKFKDDITISVNQMNSQFQDTAETDSYTETHIRSWARQLNEVQNMLQRSLNVSVVEDRKHSLVRGIKVVKTEQQATPDSCTISETNSFHSSASINTDDENFVLMFGPCKILEKGSVAHQSSYRGGLSQITGSNHYSSGKHSVSFLIENKGEKNIFIGIHSASKQLDPSSLCHSIYGWWNFDHVLIKGETDGTHHSESFQKGDTLTLTIDCNDKLIACRHDRTEVVLNLPVDLNSCPYPWQILIRLLTEGDCIRILR